MARRTSLTLKLLTPVALCAGLVAGAAAGADTRSKADVAKAMESITRTGKLAGGANYWRLAEGLHAGPKRTVAAKPFLKAKAGTRSAALTAGSRSALTTVGGEGLPEGFGKGFTWDRVEDEALLVAFINAADPLGITIDG